MDKKRFYFLRQKLVGLGLLVLSALTILLLDGDWTAAIIISPFSLPLLFGKKMYLLTSDYYEVKEILRGESK